MSHHCTRSTRPASHLVYSGMIYTEDDTGCRIVWNGVEWIEYSNIETDLELLSRIYSPLAVADAANKAWPDLVAAVAAPPTEETT